MSAPAPELAALWPTLVSLPVTWVALPEQGVTLPGGTHHLDTLLHASEDFTELFDGRGDYTEEELDDPSAVVDQRWDEARERLGTVLARAIRVLGEPAEAVESHPGRVSWPLEDRTIVVGLNQADQDCPVEVRLWLLPPGRTLDSLGL
ncbi:hypothetical protein [Deinococcus enclensis]|uniref:Uncharacterized protein n=1 Tax=Deinococcus enclensis TaxID=1049582 RepID=A0ABT9MAK0_9DEIO|nr:hypothetical protein [Deinococcus enclensis]MDP9763598.1 hypothetical protein [Deinococcus enclensis]